MLLLSQTVMYSLRMMIMSLLLMSWIPHHLYPVFLFPQQMFMCIPVESGEGDDSNDSPLVISSCEVREKTLGMSTNPGSSARQELHVVLQRHAFGDASGTRELYRHHHCTPRVNLHTSTAGNVLVSQQLQTITDVSLSLFSRVSPIVLASEDDA